MSTETPPAEQPEEPQPTEETDVLPAEDEPETVPPTAPDAEPDE